MTPVYDRQDAGKGGWRRDSITRPRSFGPGSDTFWRSWRSVLVLHLNETLEFLHLDAVSAQSVSDLSRRDAEDTGGLGLNPADLLHRADQPVAFRQARAYFRESGIVCRGSSIGSQIVLRGAEAPGRHRQSGGHIGLKVLGAGIAAVRMISSFPEEPR